VKLKTRAEKYRKKVKSGAWAYSSRYDAYYETKTRKWTEPKCKDKDCLYCAKRPPLFPRVASTRNTQR
jgi:hypothetical protein